MWLFSLLLAVLASRGYFAPEAERCQNTTIFLDEINSTWTMPHAVFYGKQRCTYEFFYPENTFLRMQFGPMGSSCSATIIDTFNVSLPYDCDTLDNFSFPPPRLTISFKFTGYSALFKNTGSQLLFLKKFSPFNSTDYFPIAPGSEPLVIMPSALKDHRTYLFDGMSSFIAYYLTRYEDFAFNEQVKSESLFLLDGSEGNVTIAGTIAHWDGPREVDKMTLYNALFNDHVHANPMLLIIHSDDLADYNNPIFKLDSPEKTRVVLDASEGMTSLTIPAFGRTRCVYYSLLGFSFSKDVEALLVQGFPKANISEDTIIQKYNASTLTKNTRLILGCTKTLIVLNGSLSVTLVRADVNLANNLKGIIRSESEKDVVESWLTNYDEEWFEIEFKWSKDSSPDAKLTLHDYHVGYSVFSPPKTVRFPTPYTQSFKLQGQATLSYNIVKTEALTTPSPSDELGPTVFPVQELCVRFRFMKCIYAPVKNPRDTWWK